MPKRYKEARLMHKAKLTEMATKLGVSQPTLSAWESERKSAPVEAVIKMATLYGVTTDYLLGLSDMKLTYNKITLDKLSEEELTILIKYRRLSFSEKSKLCGYLDALLDA